MSFNGEVIYSIFSSDNPARQLNALSQFVLFAYESPHCVVGLLRGDNRLPILMIARDVISSATKRKTNKILAIKSMIVLKHWQCYHGALEAQKEIKGMLLRIVRSIRCVAKPSVYHDRRQH